jgi:hypothetical protein
MGCEVGRRPRGVAASRCSITKCCCRLLLLLHSTPHSSPESFNIPTGWESVVPPETGVYVRSVVLGIIITSCLKKSGRGLGLVVFVGNVADPLRSR